MNMNPLSSQLFALLAVSIHKVSLPPFYLFPAGYALQSAAQGYMLEGVGEISPSGLKAHISRFSC